MRISSIQSTQLNYNKIQSYKNQNVSKVQLSKLQCEPQTAPAFKGNGKGFLIGVGAGLTTGLLTLGVTVITGGLAVPALLGAYAVGATGLAGGVIGDKIEDKVQKS